MTDFNDAATARDDIGQARIAANDFSGGGAVGNHQRRTPSRASHNFV